MWVSKTIPVIAVVVGWAVGRVVVRAVGMFPGGSESFGIGCVEVFKLLLEPVLEVVNSCLGDDDTLGCLDG